MAVTRSATFNIASRKANQGNMNGYVRSRFDSMQHVLDSIARNYSVRTYSGKDGLRKGGLYFFTDSEWMIGEGVGLFKKYTNRVVYITYSQKNDLLSAIIKEIDVDKGTFKIIRFQKYLGRTIK